MARDATNLDPSYAHYTKARRNGTIVAEAAIRRLMSAFAKAVRMRDVEGVLDECAKNISIFDLIPPLMHDGPDAVRATWANALSAFRLPINYEIHDCEITIGGEVAFARCLANFGGTRFDDGRIDHWLRTTFGLRKIAGRWKIVHAHVSVPFDAADGKALLNLQPN